MCLDNGAIAEVGDDAERNRANDRCYYAVSVACRFSWYGTLTACWHTGTVPFTVRV